ncbi:MAG: hypothetical protein K0S97_674 [Chloroflexota bacterium]|nr:hypothetical protein [Chloroflexota bacterium]
MLNTPRNRRLVPAIALSLTAAACGYLADPGQTHIAGTEDQPGPGSVLIEGDPRRATRPLVIEFVALPEGFVIEAQTARIASGGAIEASLINLPGPVSLRVNGASCEGNFAVASERLTHVVLRVTASGCSVRTQSIEPI